MSIIKRLKLKGFKSFANPTVIEFEDGFNTIVGANGSGKSNVFDALCFVLGRMSSKGLRADKLGNLVFNGGKNMKPAKEAEVSIFLSNYEKELMNVDLDEIKITRIVKRSGQSQYLLNNQKVTRTEIVEILRRADIDPDGYNIILQGDIMKIVNMSTVERRLLIEDISNISGYEEKKEKSLKKLDQVEEDLKNADLLLEEKTKYLKELKSEKDLAEKFHKVKEDLRFNSLLLLKSKLIKNRELKEKKEEQLEKTEGVLKEYKKKLDSFEEESKEIEDKIIKLEKSIEVESRNDFIEVTNKITSLEAEIKNLKEKKAENRKQIEEIKSRDSGLKENISKTKKEILEINNELKELEKKKKKLESELTNVENDLKKMKSGMGSNSNFDELNRIDSLLDELQEKKENKNLIRQDNAIQIEKLNGKLEHLEEELERINQMNSKNVEEVKKLDSYRTELKKLIMKITTTINKNTEISSKLNNINKEYNLVLEESSKLRLKVESAKDLISSNKAVETIMNFKKGDSSIHGTVAELGSVSEKYSLALETISGKSLFNIVVDDDSTAVKYINYLKDNRIGNATFLPLNKVKTKFNLDDSVLNKKGVIDYALNLINFDKRYENVFHLIFGDTIVIEKIEDAKGIGIGKYKMVTMSGDVVAKSGAMSGGFRSRKKGLGAFKDDNSLEKLASLDFKLNSLKMTIDHLKEEKEDSERIIYDLRQKKMEVESEIAKLEKVLEIEGRDNDSIKKEIEAILADKSVIESSLKKIDGDISELENEIGKLVSRKNELKKESSKSNSNYSKLDELEKKKDGIKDELMRVKSIIGSKKIQLENVLEPEIRNLEKIQKESKESIDRIKKIIEDISEKINNLSSELKELQAREKELSKGHKKFIEERDALREKKRKIEEKYNSVFEKFDKVKENAAQLRYQIGEYNTLNETLNEELENLYEQLRVELMENPNEILDESQKGENLNNSQKISELISEVDEKIKSKNIDLKELQSKVNNLKTRLNSFGSINLKAVQIYDKLNEEFNRLLEKRETLNVEKAEILGFIEEIDQKKKEKFMETFVQLKRNFIEYYSSLSSKGEIELNIEDEDNLFESGVEIKVRLSKTNYLDIKSLSGGEKTITAIAFIFAVQKFNPASFYIFDEVDAALDIMNSEKLGKLIKKNSHVAQYIVVSHSEYLIQSASSIYGVTMDKNKISGVVSLDLSNMEEFVET